MIKRTLYFENPAYLSMRLKQMVIQLPEVEKNDTLPERFKRESQITIPIEDIGVVILDHSRITITQGLIELLLLHNVAIIACDHRRMPVGLMLPLEGSTTQSQRFKYQIDSSLPLRKQLWQQVIKAKISNQAYMLAQAGVDESSMLYWSDQVRSGDPTNIEAKAAAHYWRYLFDPELQFVRDREGEPPNNLLNYGYAILRAIVARALVASGLIPTLGIHHRNKYNAYCLADDIMEPYRPFVDQIVVDIMSHSSTYEELTREIKIKLLSLPTTDVFIEQQKSPLMLAVQQTTSSLALCYQGECRKLKLPSFIP